MVLKSDIKRSKRRKKRLEKVTEDVKDDSSIDEKNLKYVTKDTWRDVLKPINLEDDEYGSEYEIDDYGNKGKKKEIYQPE